MNRSRPERVVGVLLAVVSLVLGLVLGVLESFLHPLLLRSVPVGVIGAGVANFLAAQLIGRGARSRAYAAGPGIGWLIATIVLTVQRPEGDFVVPGTWTGYGYLLAGTLGAVVGIALTPVRGLRDRG